MLSNVACIVSPDGGRRVVVTEWFRMHQHVGMGDRLFVVPGYLVQEPVPWNEIPALIARAVSYAHAQMVRATAVREPLAA